jgi:hypothetical protein
MLASMTRNANMTSPGKEIVGPYDMSNFTESFYFLLYISIKDFIRITNLRDQKLV